MKKTHIYEHPDNLGFGAHHAREQDRELVPSKELSPYEAEIVAEHLALMRRLDLHHGTEVEFSEINPDGTHRIEWIDSHGTPRATSVDPSFFTEHFRNLHLAGVKAEPTGSSRQEADYQRGEFHRPDCGRDTHGCPQSTCEACVRETAEARAANGGN